MDDFEAELREGFLTEASELISDAEQCFLGLEREKFDPAMVEQIFRLAHNLKGSAQAVGFMGLSEFTHQLESLLLRIKSRELGISKEVVGVLLQCNDHVSKSIARLRQEPAYNCQNPELSQRIEILLSGKCPENQAAAEEVGQPEDPHISTPPDSPTYCEKPHVAASGPAAKSGEESIRVSLSRIDKLMNSMGELVILQTVLSQQKAHIPSEFLQRTVGQMEKIIREAQETSMSLRMLPVRQTFQKMQRIVRDTSAALGKQVELKVSGEDTELDKTVLEQLGDPLVHLIRNAVDHGLESTEERAVAGKNTCGLIQLSAYHRGGHIVIEIADDGKGLDAAKLKAIGVERGIVRPSDSLTDEQAYQLIFSPGFSTKTEVTEVSGRGVGMDVVKTNITRIQGDILLETEKGKGTTFKIVLPLTLAIVDGLVVTMGEERFVVPVSQVTESLQPRPEDVSYITEKSEVLLLRGESIPLHRLNRVLKRQAPKQVSADQSIALIVRGENQRAFSILVDDIVCQQQVVIKRLGSELQGIHGVSGAAILGDGRASLILDLFELNQFHIGNSQVHLEKERKTA